MGGATEISGPVIMNRLILKLNSFATLPFTLPEVPLISSSPGKVHVSPKPHFSLRNMSPRPHGCASARQYTLLKSNTACSMTSVLSLLGLAQWKGLITHAYNSSFALRNASSIQDSFSANCWTIPGTLLCKAKAGYST